MKRTTLRRFTTTPVAGLGFILYVSIWVVGNSKTKCLRSVPIVVCKPPVWRKSALVGGMATLGS